MNNYAIKRGGTLYNNKSEHQQRACVIDLNRIFAFN